eukprot:TRINITY_DN2006_c0_g1_i1.p1 TRINITY_DN2006_c0_g1~~TRINITY_DN2006_c0_g1_i1.p1  ORF type:complete len:1292 (-),score=303.91 TRINITY_DN2006_c0_g1_i1:302-4177(-)
MGEPAVRSRISTASGWNCLKQLGRGQYGTAYLVEYNGPPKTDTDDEQKEDTVTRFNGNAAVVPAKFGERAVAKVVGLEFLPEKEHQAAFQEVELMRKLRHPHIVSLIDHFMTEAGLELVIVMEYCDSGDLRAEVKRRASTKPAMNYIPEAQIMLWFVQLTLALNHMHQQHILHRDLKSSNIFLNSITDGGNTVKIGDFGISRVLEGTVDVAATVVGTPYYMSPEVCKAEPYGYKSDIWALGCVLYEMCMLKHAFESQSLLGLVYKIVSEIYDPIPQQYSGDLRGLMDRILDKSHFTRPSGKALLTDPFVRRFVPQATAGGAAEATKSGNTLQVPRIHAQPAEPTGAQLSASPLPKEAEKSPAPPLPKPTTLRPSLQPRAATSLGGPRLTEASPSPPDVGQDGGGMRRQWCSQPCLSPKVATSAAMPAPQQQQSMDERDLRVYVVLRRIHLALATRRQNWLQVFASFDRAGSGQLAEAEFEQAITSMALGLSDGEIREVRRHLQGTGVHVAVDRFGAALHQVPEQVMQLESWGRGVITDLAREAASETCGGGLGPGAQVRVQGLSCALGKRLNGSEGVIDKWDASACRWAVRCSDGSISTFSDEHLVVTRASSASTDPQAIPETYALYRMLVENGETAVPDYRFFDVVRRLLPELTEAQRCRLLLLVPKCPEGRIDVPELLSQLVHGTKVGEQTLKKTLLPTLPAFTTPEKPVKKPQRPPMSALEVSPNPDFRLQTSKRLPTPQIDVGSAVKGRSPATSVPGTVPSPRVCITGFAKSPSPVPRSKLAASTNVPAGSKATGDERFRAVVGLFRLAQRLKSLASGPGPGVEVLRLFAAQPYEMRMEDFLDAVSVLPLGISRGEVPSVFAHMKHISDVDMFVGEAMPFSAIVSAIDCAQSYGVPAEAAVLEHIDAKRLGAALQRLDSAGGGSGRASPQEFRVTLMQAEPYLTPCQLEWLMLLTDKDGEGRLIPLSLLPRIGVAPVVPTRGAVVHLLVPPRPAGRGPGPIAPHTLRSVVVAALLARLRGLLAAAGAQLTLERIINLFDLDNQAQPTRDTLASLLGHLRLGISAAEADELVGCICVGAGGVGAGGVQLASLFDAIRRAGEPEMESLVHELREEAKAYLYGRAHAFAPCADVGDWVSEADFRRCLQQALSIADDGSAAAPVDGDLLDRLVLLAEKNAGGDVRWKCFLQALAGSLDSESWGYDVGMQVSSYGGFGQIPSSPKRLPRVIDAGTPEPSITQQSWRSTKVQQAGVRQMATAPPCVPEEFVFRQPSDPPPARGLFRCFRKLLW